MIAESPPKEMIEHALTAARRSPCAKSKRGVVAYYDPDIDPAIADVAAVGGVVHLDGDEEDEPKATAMFAGFNGPPSGFECYGNDECRRDCPKRCVHAEIRAIRMVPTTAPLTRLGCTTVLLHVELDEENDVVMPCDGPKCWQCSREILDCGFVHGIWLLEQPKPDVVRRKMDEALAEVGTSVARSDNMIAALERAFSKPAWRYYEARDFHRETLARLGICA